MAPPGKSNRPTGSTVGRYFRVELVGFRPAAAIRTTLREGGLNPGQPRRVNPPGCFPFTDGFRASSTPPVNKNNRQKSGGCLGFSGASRIRTGDPLLAKQVLYQLSYTPLVEERRAPRSFIPGAISGPGTKKAGLVSGFPVGTGRVELPTSTLSVWRSNQLS